MAGGKVHRQIGSADPRPGGSATDVNRRSTRKRHTRHCVSAPKVPTGLAVAFVQERSLDRQIWRARVTWNGVTQDVADRPLVPEGYAIELRYTDASGVPINIAGSSDDVRRAFVPADDSPLKAVFQDLARPRSWYVQVRIRTLNRVHGGRCWSAWSAWTTATQPSTGALPGPPAPTGVTLTFDKVEGFRKHPWRARVRGNEIGTWTPAEGDPLDGVASYVIRLGVSNDGGSTVANVRRVEVPAVPGETYFKKDFLYNIRGKRHYRTQVAARDTYGRLGAFTAYTSWASPGGAPDPVQNLTWGKPVPGLLVAKWDPPTDFTDADRYSVTVIKGASTVVDTGFTYGTRWVYHIPAADRTTSHKVRVKAVEDEVALDIDDTPTPGYAAPDESTQVESAAVTNDTVWGAADIDPNALAGTDGNAPASSPTPTVRGGLGTLFVEWTPLVNADPVTYEVYASTSTGFTPGAGNKIGETDASAFTIRTLTGGVALVYGTTYYVKLIAKDADGAAAAGSQGSGTPVQVNSPDIVAESIISSLLASGSITADKLVSVLILAGAIKTAETGQRVEIDTQGVRLLASDNTVLVDIPTTAGEDATFNGQVLAAALEVLGSSTHRGVGTLTPGAAWVLSLSVPDPITAPTLTVDWETLFFGDGSQVRNGLTYDATAGTFYTGREVRLASTYYITEYSAAGAHVRSAALDSTVSTVSGAVRVGTRVYALYKKSVGGSNTWYIGAFAQSNLAFLGEVDVTANQTNVIGGAIGSDGTNVFITDLNGSGAVRFHKYSLADTPAFVSTTTSTGKTFALGTTMRGFAAAESGWWIGIYGDSFSNNGAHKYNTSAAYQTNTDFKSKNDGLIFGLAHDGTRFWTVDPSQTNLIKHSNWNWTTESSVYWAGYTWFNNGSSAESLVSPRAQIVMKRRARLRVGNPLIQAGADRVRVYLNRGATEPAGGSPTRFSGFLQVTDALTTRDLATFDNAGTPPENPGANGFGGSTPAELRSSGGEPLVRANGFSRAKASYAGGGNVADTTLTYIRFGTEIVDTDSYHPATTDALNATGDSTYDFTLPFAGQYLVILNTTFATNNAGFRRLQLNLAGSSYERTTFFSHGVEAQRGMLSTMVDANAGDALRAAVFQNSGGALALSAAKLSIVYLGPA